MPKPDAAYYTSPLSEFCAEELGSDFHFLDGDEVIFHHSAQPMVFARETGILRVLESKRPGEQIRRSQRETLPVLAGALELAIRAKQIHRLSGVFVIEGSPPWGDGAIVSKVRPAKFPIDWSAIAVQAEKSYHLDREQLATFIRCRPLGQGDT